MYNNAISWPHYNKITDSPKKLRNISQLLLKIPVVRFHGRPAPVSTTVKPHVPVFADQFNCSVIPAPQGTAANAAFADEQLIKAVPDRSVVYVATNATDASRISRGHEFQDLHSAGIHQSSVDDFWFCFSCRISRSRGCLAADCWFFEDRQKIEVEE